MTSVSGRVRVWGAAAVAALILGAASACEPCSGVAACEVTPAARVSGRIVEFPSRRAVARAEVTLSATVGTPPLTVRTDAEGYWSAILPKAIPGVDTLTLEVQVTAPGATDGYRVPGVRVPVSRAREDAVWVGRWFSTPYVRFIGEARRRNGQRLAGAELTVTRVGGAAAAFDVVRTTVSPDGIFYLEAPARDAGGMVLRLEARSPGSDRVLVRQTLGVQVMHQDTVPLFQGIAGFGPSLEYVIGVFDRFTDRPVSGVRVTLRRTGGVPTVEPSVTGVTNADGYVYLGMTPDAAGELIGDLELVPPAPRPSTVIQGFRWSTFDSDSLRLGRMIRLGAMIRSAVVLFERATRQPLANAEVEFVPTVGPLTTPLTGRTDGGGVVGFVAQTLVAGVVTGDLIVRPAPPLAPDVLRGVQFLAAEDDEVRLAAVGLVGPALLYIGIVTDAANRRITSGKIEFRRTGGVRVRDPVFEWAIDGNGAFRIAPTPLEDGEVVGDLTLRLPSPYRDTTLTNVRLATFRTDENRFAGFFRVANPRAIVRSVVQLYERATRRPLVDAEVEFQPRSGPVSIVLTGRTDAAGVVGFVAGATAEGLVEGDLLVRPRAPLPADRLNGIRLVAADDDSVRLAAVELVGASLLYIGLVADEANRPITGGRIEFRRTGGIRVRDELFEWPIDGNAAFRVAPTPLEDGEVVGDLTLRLPAPYLDTTFTNVKLTAFRTDESRFAGVFRVRSP